jgi:hypothetical protein
MDRTPQTDTGTRRLPTSLCRHTPTCPAADSPDREAAIVVASHPEQGWSLLCNDVLLFEVMSISDAEEAADQGHYETDMSSSGPEAFSLRIEADESVLASQRSGVLGHFLSFAMGHEQVHDRTRCLVEDRWRRPYDTALVVGVSRHECLHVGRDARLRRHDDIVRFQVTLVELVVGRARMVIVEGTVTVPNSEVIAHGRIVAGGSSADASRPRDRTSTCDPQEVLGQGAEAADLPVGGLQFPSEVSDLVAELPVAFECGLQPAVQGGVAGSVPRVAVGFRGSLLELVDRGDEVGLRV